MMQYRNVLSSDDLLALQNEVEILSQVEYAKAMFQNIAQIDHPNVVKLLEIFEDKENFYMVLELMTGGEVKDTQIIFNLLSYFKEQWKKII